MNARRSKTRDEQADSINRERELEASAEKKVLHVWQSFDQMFGKRWGDNFGTDPLGKAAKDNRMSLWIDALKYTSWPAVKAAINKIMRMPRPSEWWLPDLQTFITLAGKEQQAIAPPEPARRRAATWVEQVCNLFLLRLMFDHGPFSEASMERLEKAKTSLVADYQSLMDGGEISKEGTPEEEAQLRSTLAAKVSRIHVDPMSQEEKEAAIRRSMIGRSPSPTKANSSSSEPTGSSEAGGQSSFV